MSKINLKVNGMHCNSCKIIVRENLEELGAKNISINLDEKKKSAKISLDYSGNKEDIVKVIEKEGYKVEWILNYTAQI